MNKLLFLIVSAFLVTISGTAMATVTNYDPVCVAAIERGKTEVAENTVFNAEENILIVEFEEKYLMIKVTDSEKISKIMEELGRGYTPVGTIVKSGGEDWIAVYTAARTNNEAGALDCAPIFIKKDPKPVNSGEYKSITVSWPTK